MQDSAQPCTSTSTSGCTNRNDSKINQAVRLINALKHENKKLNTENTELREHLAVITQRHNELLTNEARLVDHEQDVCAPTAQNETIQMLTRQVETLKLELEGKQNVCPEDVLQQEEYNNIIEDYRKAIKTKDEEIHKLRAKCGQPEMISKLENMLDKARGTIRIFADQIEALKLEMQSMTKESQASTEGVTIQAASADDDVNGHHNTSPRQSVHTVDSVSRDEYEKVKELNLTLQDKLNAAVTAKETATAELVTTRADNATLRDEQAQLLLENESLKQQLNNQQGELVQSQMKAFMEDFTLERQEKQQLMQQKENLRGENTNLKQHLNELKSLLAQQQHAAAQTQPYKPALSHTGIVQAVYEHDQVQPFHDRYANPQSAGMPMHLPNAPPPQVSRQQSSLVHSRAPPMQESSIRPMAAPVESQPRRIGFPQTNPQLEASHNLPNAGYMQQASPPPAFQAEAYDYHRTPVQPQHRYPRTSSDGHVESMQPQSLPNQSPPEKH